MQITVKHKAYILCMIIGTWCLFISDCGDIVIPNDMCELTTWIHQVLIMHAKEKMTKQITCICIYLHVDKLQSHIQSIICVSLSYVLHLRIGRVLNFVTDHSNLRKIRVFYLLYLLKYQFIVTSMTTYKQELFATSSMVILFRGWYICY